MTLTTEQLLQRRGTSTKSANMHRIYSTMLRQNVTLEDLTEYIVNGANETVDVKTLVNARHRPTRPTGRASTVKTTGSWGNSGKEEAKSS